MIKELKERLYMHQEDAVWVREFQAGDDKAFDRIFTKYEKKVFNLCSRLLGDYEDASDSAQETFVKIYRSLNKFRFDSAFSTWLYRITVNTCKNKQLSLAYRIRKKMDSLSRHGNPDENLPDREILDDSQSPGIEYEKQEKMGLIQNAIESLAPDQRMLVVLRDMEGLAYEEIQKITGYNIGTVKSKLSRARQNIREKLKGIV